MSRVAEKPILIPNQVNVEVSDSLVTVKGPLGELSHKVPTQISIVIEGNILKVVLLEKNKWVQAQAGTLRAKLYNQVKGVSEGFSFALTLVKVGANAQIDGNYLVLKIGYSNPKRYRIQAGIDITTPNPTEVIIKGIDIQKVNQVAAEIIKIRSPDAYKGTGILKKGQSVKLKVAKKK